MKKDLLSMMDLNAEDIDDILKLALRIKRSSGAIMYGEKQDFHPLKGKTLGLIFQKPSTRTRVSFEAGMYRMGGYALYLNTNDLQLGRGEPMMDTANVLSRYLDGIMIRTYKHSEAEELAKHASVPVINGLTDYEHPCQILGDLLTIHEYKGDLQGLKVAFIGDGNNVANSLIIGGLTCGMKVSIACPEGYEPHEKVLDFAKNNNDFHLTRNPFEAASGADVVFTDVWASMGQDGEAKERKQAFAGFMVDEELMAYADANAMVQHCLPAHRGEEISAEVFEKHAEEIYDEAENRMHTQNAVMAMLMGDK